jgi:hypothetical protein
LIDIHSGRQSKKYRGRSPKSAASKLFSALALNYVKNQQPLPIPFKISIKEIGPSERIFTYEYNSELHEEHIQKELTKRELQLRNSYARRISCRTSLIKAREVPIQIKYKPSANKINISDETFNKKQISDLVIETICVKYDDNFIIEI